MGGQKYETWHSYTLPKEDRKKYMNHVTHPLSSAVLSIFNRKSANFAISENTNIDCILVIPNSFKFFLSLQRFFDKLGYSF